MLKYRILVTRALLSLFKQTPFLNFIFITFHILSNISISLRLPLCICLAFNFLFHFAYYASKMTKPPSHKSSFTTTYPVNTPYFYSGETQIITLCSTKPTLGQHHNVTLHNCLHIPNAPGHGLLSIPHLLDLNYSIMLAGHSPHLIVSHIVHRTTLNLPKYFPLSRSENQFFLKAIFIETLLLTHSTLVLTSSHPPHPHQPSSLSTILPTKSTSLTGPQPQAIVMSSISPFIRLAPSSPPGLTPTPTPLPLPLPSQPPVPPRSPIFPSQ